MQTCIVNWAAISASNGGLADRVEALSDVAKIGSRTERAGLS